MVISSLDDFRYAVALRFRSQVLDQKSHSESPDDRDKDHKSPPGACGCMNVGVVCRREFAKEEEIVKDPNEGAKCHGSQACHDPYQQR